MRGVDAVDTGPSCKAAAEDLREVIFDLGGITKWEFGYLARGI